ncbi:MAG: hypothetical protein NZ572_04755 [Thermoflexus sp.]|nr:hypothetical protein [Thermoflexus sp.]
MIDLSSMIAVPLPKDRPFDRHPLQQRIRSRRMAHPKRETLFRTAEDLVLSKLEGFRQGDKVSQSEWQDVPGIPWV